MKKLKLAPLRVAWFALGSTVMILSFQNCGQQGLQKYGQSAASLVSKHGNQLSFSTEPLSGEAADASAKPIRSIASDEQSQEITLISKGQASIGPFNANESLEIQITDFDESDTSICVENKYYWGNWRECDESEAVFTKLPSFNPALRGFRYSHNMWRASFVPFSMYDSYRIVVRDSHGKTASRTFESLGRSGRDTLMSRIFVNGVVTPNTMHVEPDDTIEIYVYGLSANDTSICTQIRAYSKDSENREIQGCDNNNFAKLTNNDHWSYINGVWVGEFSGVDFTRDMIYSLYMKNSKGQLVISTLMVTNQP